MRLRTFFGGSRDFNSYGWRPEGDDLSIWLLGLPVELVNESLDVMDGLQARPRSLDAACGVELRTVVSDMRCAPGTSEYLAVEGAYVLDACLVFDVLSHGFPRKCCVHRYRE